jgi:hypothetical protein
MIPRSSVTLNSGLQTDPMAAGYRIISVQCASANTRVRVYRTAAQRAADAARSFATLPVGDAVILDMLCDTTDVFFTNPVSGAYRPSGEPSVYFNIEGAGSTTLTWQRAE